MLYFDFSDNKKALKSLNLSDISDIEYQINDPK